MVPKTDECKEKISESVRISMVVFKREISKKLKKQVKIRDNFTCQVCGLFDLQIMEVDHMRPIRDYPELVEDLNNLVTLCPNCHRRKSFRNKEMGGRKK